MSKSWVSNRLIKKLIYERYMLKADGTGVRETIFIVTKKYGGAWCQNLQIEKKIGLSCVSQ